jgi:hypothetical protein
MKALLAGALNGLSVLVKVALWTAGTMLLLHSAHDVIPGIPAPGFFQTLGLLMLVYVAGRFFNEDDPFGIKWGNDEE